MPTSTVVSSNTTLKFLRKLVYTVVLFFANRSTAKYCSSTCRGYANQAKNLNEAAPLMLYFHK